MDDFPVRFQPPPAFPPFLVSGAPQDPVSQLVAFLLLPLLVLRTAMGGAGLPALGGSMYSNEESWEIRRGPGGRIEGVVIHREATER